MIPTLTAAIGEHGFVVIPRHLNPSALAGMRDWHAAALAAADPSECARSASGSNTRVHLPRAMVGAEQFYADPLLAALAARALGGPIQLSAFLSRTVHPGAAAQQLHADCPAEHGRTAMLGFIYTLDDFHGGNGATRFVPGSHRVCADGDGSPVIAPAGSLIIYDGAVRHGFAAHTGGDDRRSIQGSFVPRMPATVAPPPHKPRSALARYLLGEPVALDLLRTAIAASWDASTAYLGAGREGNPAFGQCYPTARAVEWFRPELRIVAGHVETREGLEWHFWNVGPSDEDVIDFSWQQFPLGSTKRDRKPISTARSDDSIATQARCRLLLDRVLARLAQP